MNTPENRPYMTASSAARELGYTQGGYLSTLCAAGKIPGAYKSGRIWLVPVVWVEEQKKKDAALGIKRGTGKAGRPVTTGAGLRRKDRGGPGGSPNSTGKPRGRPKKAT